MALTRIRATYYRGGTSRALIFRAQDLPPDRAEWDAIFLSAMGVPDVHGRNLDGMGGGLSSLNKVCVVGPPSRDDADVDYTFVQLSIDNATVDYSGNCGNMSSAVGPFAVEEGLLPRPEDGDTTVRIHNTNSGKIILARFPVQDGALAPDGGFAIDGVAGTAAPIKLEFLDPGGGKTGKLLPTGNPVDRIEGIEASLIDAANPCVFVRASDLGKTGSESPAELEADSAWLERMEAIRQAGAKAMGLPQVPSIPKVAMVASPPPLQGRGSGSGGCPDGTSPADKPHPNPSPEGEGLSDICIRMISVGQPHRAVPITGAVCLAVAARIEGTIPHQLCQAGEGPIVIGHPSGTTQVDARVVSGRAEYGAVYRTARRLMEGSVLFRTPPQ